jgi:ribose 1,5-bisphosphokinase PhnN
LNALARGCDVLFNGSRAALPAARAVFPDLRVILVTAPRELLADRLAARGRESRAEIAARLDRGAFLLPPDIVPILVVNDGTVAEGIARLRAALHAARGTVPSA